MIQISWMDSSDIREITIQKLENGRFDVIAKTQLQGTLGLSTEYVYRDIHYVDISKALKVVMERDGK